MLGTLYADPAASASTLGQPPAKRDNLHFAECATLAGITKVRYESIHSIETSST